MKKGILFAIMMSFLSASVCFATDDSKHLAFVPVQADRNYVCAKCLNDYADNLEECAKALCTLNYLPPSLGPCSQPALQSCGTLAREDVVQCLKDGGCIPSFNGLK